jgi:hypothetical protein
MSGMDGLARCRQPAFYSQKIRQATQAISEVQRIHLIAMPFTSPASQTSPSGPSSAQNDYLFGASDGKQLLGVIATKITSFFLSLHYRIRRLPKGRTNTSEGSRSLKLQKLDS